jgi:hypothetical protein
MKPIAAAILILASILTIHFALGASSPDRPAGVDAQHWIPVSDKMGFVVTTPSIPGRRVTTDGQPLLLASPEEGYFMVHRGDVWQRITIKDPLKGPGSSG